MAEKMVDVIIETLGLKSPCMTAEYPLDGQDELSGYPLSKRLGSLNNIVCECELVSREEVERTVNKIGTKYISDIQHRTRLGMGPCQGGFCTYRALGHHPQYGARDSRRFHAHPAEFPAEPISGYQAGALGGPTPERAARGGHLSPHPQHGAGSLSESEYDIVIIGGGVSGLMAAIYLAENRYRVAVVSQGDPVPAFPRGVSTCWRTATIPWRPSGSCRNSTPIKGLQAMRSARPLRSSKKPPLRPALNMWDRRIRTGASDAAGHL